MIEKLGNVQNNPLEIPNNRATWGKNNLSLVIGPATYLGPINKVTPNGPLIRPTRCTNLSLLSATKEGKLKEKKGG